MDIAVSVIATLLLTVLNGFFSMSEMALTTAKRATLEHDAEEGDRRAAKALELATDSTDFLATIQVAITLVGFFSATVSSNTLSDPLTSAVESLGVEALSAVAPVASPIVITLVVSYLSIVVGELVPKRIGLSDAEGMAKRVSGPISGFRTLAKPLVWLTQASANGLSALLGIKSADDRQNVSEEEIRYMVTDSGELSEEEKSMIHEIFDLADTKTREVMVPRVDVTFAEDTCTIAEVLSVMRRTGYSRLPVFHEDQDRIVGIAHIKDIIGPMVDEDAGDRPITSCLREADFVPDTKDIIPLLSEMQSSHDQMVIVVDEYGGTAGVITVEDIIEEVVGEIEDEFDPDNKYLTQLGPGDWLVDGRFSTDDAVELGWPVEESEGFETIAGYVLDLADSLPDPGDAFEVEGYRFRVQSVRGRRIALLRVTAPAPEPEEGEAAEDEAGDDPDGKD